MGDQVSAVVAAAIGGVIGALVAVAALVAVVLVVRRGSRSLLGMIGGGGGHRINVSSAPAAGGPSIAELMEQDEERKAAERGRLRRGW